MPLGPHGVGARIPRARFTSRAARFVAAALCVGVLALTLAGCQVGASFKYVSHRAPDGVDMYFKLPPNWNTFNTDQVIEAQNGKLGPTQLKQISSGEWVESMSPEPRVTAKDSLGIGRSYPTAVVQSDELGASQRDDLNFSAMRSLVLGTDPLTATSGFDVLNYSDFTLPGGIRGIKMIVDITDTSPVVTYGQVTAVDAGTDWVFSVEVSCQASCWGANASAITDLLNSWTLKEQSP